MGLRKSNASIGSEKHLQELAIELEKETFDTSELLLLNITDDFKNTLL